MYGDIAGTAFIVLWIGFMWFMLKPKFKAANVWIEPMSDLAVMQRKTVVKAERELNPQLVIGVKR